MTAIAAIAAQIATVLTKIANIAAAVALIRPELPRVPTGLAAITRLQIRSYLAPIGVHFAGVVMDLAPILSNLAPVAADFSGVLPDVARSGKRRGCEPEQEQAGNGRKVLHRVPPSIRALAGTFDDNVGLERCRPVRARW